MRPDVREMQERVRAEIAMPSRLTYTGLLVAAVAMTATAASLWATEASLPARTQWAFALMVAIGSGWIAFACWVLLRRRVLYGRQRIVAAQLGLFAATVFVSGAIFIREVLGTAAVVTGAVLWLIAATTVVAARRHVTRLEAKKRALEQEAFK